MENLKFNANELLQSMNMELNGYEMDELYKALIAYSLGLDEITPAIDKQLKEVLNFYYDADHIAGIVNDDVMFYAKEVFNEED